MRTFLRHPRPAALAALLALALPALAANVSEYSVKSAYLYNFAKLASWPASAFRGPGDPLVIGILGDDPFGNVLDSTLKGRKAGPRDLSVKRIRGGAGEEGEALKECHILFIAQSEKDRLKEVLASLKGRPILTVSEIDRFQFLGGMILFERQGDRIDLTLDPKTAKKAGLSLGPEILEACRLSYKADAEKVKTLYYEGIKLYLDGNLTAAIKKWNECLEEDPRNEGALKNLEQARAKLKGIRKLK